MSSVYALRHKATHFCMPQLGKGHSYWEPLFDNHEGLHPRLFFSIRSAQNARSSWARGPWKADSWSGHDWEGTPDGFYEVVPVNPAHPRSLNDLEIIPLTLSEVVQ